MCGIVGVSLDFIEPRQIELVKKVLLESQIRGLHASGITWSDDNKLHSRIAPVPMSELLHDNPSLLEKTLTEGHHMRMIAHVRYSTSDLEFNQPIIDEDLAIVHNGVITQSPSYGWESEFSLKISTKNDSELILRTLQNNEDPIDKFPDASIAYISLDKTGDIFYARNGKRPLYVTPFRNGYILTSTKDIMLRASNGAHRPLMILPHGDTQELQ